MKERKLRSLGVALLGALALFLASCGQQPPPSNGGGGGGGGGGAPTTGTLEVLVKDASNNSPIQGAQVLLTNTSTSLGVTDSNGKVTATLAPGTYGLQASKSGYASSTATAVVVAGETRSVTISLQPQPSPPGPGVCRPRGDTSFTTTLKGVEGGLLKSIQRTNGSGEDCFAKGKVEFSVQAPGASRVQVVLATTDNFAAGELRASGRDSATFTLDTATLPQGKQLYIIARVEKDNRITDQYWVFVPDNLGPQIPDVRPVNKLSPDNPSDRWVNGTVQLQLQNPDFRDNPSLPGLLASGLAKVTYYAQPLGGGDSIKIGEVGEYPYTISWKTTDFADGRYRVYAVAEDVMGNRSQYAGFVVGVDNTAPTLDLVVEDAGTLDVQGGLDIFPAERGYVSGVAKVAYVACDGPGGVGFDSSSTSRPVDLNWGAGNISLNPACIRTPVSPDIDLNNVDDGQVTFTLRAKDRLGNEARKEVTVTVDNNAPTLDHFNINAPTKVGNQVNAGDQATYEVLAYDPTSGIREVRYYYASFYGSTNTPLADGGLFEIARRSSALSRVVFPVFDPENKRSNQPPSDLWVIAIAVDRAGNAKAFYQTLKVAHTAPGNNGIDPTGAQLNRTSLPGGLTEYQVVRSGSGDPNDLSNVLTNGTTLKVAFYQEGFFDGAGLPQGMPAGVTTTVRSLVAEVSTPPYKYLYGGGLYALLFNEFGHWGDVR